MTETLWNWFLDGPPKALRRDPKRTDERRAKAWPMEKQRRSTVDWYALVPDDVAYAQIQWERQQTVLAMQKTGMTLAAIGRLFGLTRESVRVMRVKAERRILNGDAPPVHAYYGEALFRKYYNAKDKTWRVELSY